jgi:hypothetical protein
MDTNRGTLNTIAAIAMLVSGLLWGIQAVVDWINGERPLLSTAASVIMIVCGAWILLTRPPTARG